MLEQGPDFWRWFYITRFSCHCVHPIHAKVFSIQMLLHFFSQIVTRVCTLVLFIQLGTYQTPCHPNPLIRMILLLEVSHQLIFFCIMEFIMGIRLCSSHQITGSLTENFKAVNNTKTLRKCPLEFSRHVFLELVTFRPLDKWSQTNIHDLQPLLHNFRNCGL